MSKEYYRCLSKLLMRSRFFAFSAILFVAFPCLVIGCWSYSIMVSIAFICLFALLVVYYFLISKKAKNITSEPWESDINCEKMVLPDDSYIELYPNLFVSKTTYNNKKIRTLLHIVNSYESSAVSRERKKANAKANKILGESKKVSLFSASRVLRINLIVAEESNKELRRWVQNTNQTINRVESIINIAIARNEHKLLIPRIQGLFEVSQVTSYKTAVEYVQSLVIGDGLREPF